MQRLYFIIINFIRATQFQDLLRTLYVNLSMFIFNKHWVTKNSNCGAIHCYGKTNYDCDKKNWSEILSQYIGEPIKNFCVDNIANETIIENIITSCNKHIKPKVIFVLFEEIEKIEFFTETGEVINMHYDDLPDINFYKGINAFHNFLFHLEYLNLFCENNNIKLYWFIDTKYSMRFGNDQCLNLLTNKTLYNNNKLLRISRENFNNELTAKFANLYFSNK